mgnify:CR=1 FL=1
MNEITNNQCLKCTDLFIEIGLVGTLKLAKEQTLPFWWDDASDFSVLEDFAVGSYSNVSVFQYIFFVCRLLKNILPALAMACIPLM